MSTEKIVTVSNKEKYAKAFVKNLKQLMAEQNFTQESLAEEAEISANTIKSYTRSNKVTFPDYETLASLANVFGVSTDYLCGNEANSPENLRISYFRDFIKRVQRLELDVQITENTLSFSTNNPTIINSFKSALEDDFNDDEVLFVTFGGKLFSVTEYTELKKQFYVYGHLIEIDEDEDNTIDDYISALENAIKSADITTDEDYQTKVKEWTKSNGNPRKYISDEYYDLFISK